jgi:hypothetical protein
MLHVAPTAALICCGCEIGAMAERQVRAGTDARAATKFGNCCAALVGSSEPKADGEGQLRRAIFD